MQSRHLLLTLLWLFCPVCITEVLAQPTQLALSGDDAAGIAGATWKDFSSATLNNDGVVALVATLEPGGEVTSNNDTGVWLLEGSDRSLLARTGISNVPDVENAKYGSLDSAMLNDAGDVVVSGTLALGEGGITASNDRGIWRYGDSNSLLARTGAGNVPDLPGTNFSGFPGETSIPQFAFADDGRVAVAARLELLAGGVLSSNNLGLWSYSSSEASLIARRGSGGVPGIAGADFKSFALAPINTNDQQAVFASLEKVGGITSDNDVGIWRYAGTSGELIAQSGSGNVPGAAGLNYVGFDLPLLNDVGEIVFSARLSGDGSRGVWSYAADTTGTLLARSGAGGVPELPEANFQEFTVTSTNALSQVLVEAILETGPAGVTEDDKLGLWILGSEEKQLARTGAGEVPGVPEANFASFAARSLNVDGQVALAADLQVGAGGVDSSNDSGIWIVGVDGSSALVAREGDQLGGRTVAGLDFLGDGLSQTSGFNDLGELVFTAHFTDGDRGLFLYRPPSTDFNRDGRVDQVDLDWWEAAFATNSTADSDSDNDSDGADFLAWQREFGGVFASQEVAQAVPEPSGAVLLMILGLLVSACPIVRCNRYS